MQNFIFDIIIKQYVGALSNPAKVLIFLLHTPILGLLRSLRSPSIILTDFGIFGNILALSWERFFELNRLSPSSSCSCLTLFRPFLAFSPENSSRDVSNAHFTFF